MNVDKLLSVLLPKGILYSFVANQPQIISILLHTGDDQPAPTPSASDKEDGVPTDER